jgi:hypothetical protein
MAGLAGSRDVAPPPMMSVSPGLLLNRSVSSCRLSEVLTAPPVSETKRKE